MNANSNSDGWGKGLEQEENKKNGELKKVKHEISEILERE